MSEHARDDALLFLQRTGLGGGSVEMQPLSGGVSSNIWRVTINGRIFVVKQAVAQLRVQQVWEAPLSRNRFEVDWLNEANRIVPDAVPEVIARDDDLNMFAMWYFDADSHTVWKTELRNVCADPEVAASVGRIIGRLHQATANSAAIAARFDTDDTFLSIRVDPYLYATATRHSDLAETLRAIGRDILATKQALVHGDLSPKNILVGPKGPVLLDAECAWYGEPAFDVAFCLNHLYLKCVWVPAAAEGYLACVDALTDAYLTAIRFELAEAIARRIARILPALMLARIDGKSPVEYITDEHDKARVRRVARALLHDDARSLATIRSAWTTEFSA